LIRLSELGISTNTRKDHALDQGVYSIKMACLANFFSTESVRELLGKRREAIIKTHLRFRPLASEAPVRSIPVNLGLGGVADHGLSPTGYVSDILKLE
jgi:hypothetical protein